MATAVLSALCMTVAFLAGSSLAYNTFQGEIPNGKNVPHPCKANYMWPGVGHENRLGGGVNNQFGVDFRNMGYWWSEELCRHDSDGDGTTNGFELGDRDCKWKPGDLPERTTNITHPGICDPFGSPQCQGENYFVDCELEGFVCPRINGSDVRHIDMAFVETMIPATETNYYCMTFDLPTDQDYHVIATEPIMDNLQVLHHILVYACDDDNATDILKPQLCGMEADSQCGTIIGLWTVGNSGLCFGDGIGYRFGLTTFKKVKLEIHYNNPMEIVGQTDKSGLRLYYQPAKPEVEDLVTLTVGTNQLAIPPGKSKYSVESTCKGSCTNYMVTKPAKIFGGINHMHYMGAAMSVELFRNGEKIADITRDPYYNYDSPVVHTHTPVLDLWPGDEIRTTCEYNSMNTDTWTYYGDATSDEMCFGFLFVYPKDSLAFDQCMTFGELDICDLYGGTPLPTPIGECQWGAFTHFSEDYTPPWVQEVQKTCRYNPDCRSDCRETVERLMKEPCMHKDASGFVFWRLSEDPQGVEAMARINTCRGVIMAAMEGSHTGGGDTGDHHGMTCGWDECSMYCNDKYGDNHGSGSSYDGSPKMAAPAWLIALTAGLLLSRKLYL